MSEFQNILQYITLEMESDSKYTVHLYSFLIQTKTWNLYADINIHHLTILFPNKKLSKYKIWL